MASVSVEIDVDDILDQLTDKHLLKELEQRKLDRKGEPDAKEVVTRAIVLIKSGRVDDGVTLLEREFFPTWKDKAACEAAYATAMALKAS